MNRKIPLPSHITFVMNSLKKHGYEAFVVGGCVRDGILNIPINDYDIATNALPNEILSVFDGCKTLVNGLKHGTVTVIINQTAVEITTYRTDGKYSDNRHPDSVSFTRDLKNDIARRDFTVNALAYSPETGIIDIFGGESDINNKILRCVGDPKKRFEEDSLRILRGLRFAARFGLNIEEQTRDAMLGQRHLLNNISRERVCAEFNKLMVCDNAADILNEYKEVFAVCMPEIEAMFDFAQDNPHHDFNVWQHTINVIKNTPPDLELRLAALFHDIGKPGCKTTDENGIGHFYGHAEISEEIAVSVMKSLKQSNALTNNVALLVKYHCRTGDIGLKGMRRLYGILGYELTEKLIALTKADTFGQKTEISKDKAMHINELYEMLKKITESNLCCKHADLKVNGNDILSLGVARGKIVGEILDDLLNKVLSGELENDRDCLLKYTKAKYTSKEQ